MAQLGGVLTIRQVEMFSDNYGYVIVDESNKTCYLVDPAEPGAITKELLHLDEENNIQCTHILNTHKHFDHVGGNESISSFIGKGLEVFGSAKEAHETPCITRGVQGGDSLQLSCGDIQVLDTPCHTRGTIDTILYSNVYSIHTM